MFETLLLISVFFLPCDFPNLVVYLLMLVMQGSVCSVCLAYFAAIDLFIPFDLNNSLTSEKLIGLIIFMSLLYCLIILYF